MTRSVDVHVVLSIEVETDDAGIVVAVGEPYVEYESPFNNDGEAYVCEPDDPDACAYWRDATEAEAEAAFDEVDKTLRYARAALQVEANLAAAANPKGAA